MEDFKCPFWKNICEKSGSIRLIDKIRLLSKSDTIGRLAFYCCLPYNTIYTIYATMSGFYNKSTIHVNSNAKYNLAVVAIAKNESEYIAEWLAFNIASGVEHFFIYDNDSTDSMPDILQKFSEAGYVTYNKIHGERQQGNAYNDAFKRYGNDCKYMAFIDCDEYLQTVDPNKGLVEEIDRLLDGDNSRAGVVVNWVMYGSSHYEKKPEGLCFESFIQRALPGKRGTNVVKSIVRPECVKSYYHPHVPIYKSGFYNVNTIGVRTDGWKNEIEDYQSLRLNHYFTKSKEQWIIRRSAKRADTGTTRTLDEFYAHDNNDVVDNSALVYLEKVKNIISKILG